MKPATSSHRRHEEARLMVIENEQKNVTHQQVGHLPEIFRAGDLLVVNTAGTLPSSFHGVLARTGESLELRLAAFQGERATDLRRWSAIAFGAGDWHQSTEQRGIPPLLRMGDVIQVNANLAAKICKVDPTSSRLVEIEFRSVDLVHDLFETGRPIQYSYLEADLEVWDQQTLFSGPPIAAEPPSAAFQLNWSMLLEIKKRGASVCTILHSAGLSSTGDPVLDQRLPLAEYYEVPDTTMRHVRETHASGGRVFALGTTVTRALESAFRDEHTAQSNGSHRGLTTLRLGGASALRAVDALITGMHEEGTSHMELMKAFCDPELLLRADREASARSYLAHEFGDLAVLIRSNR